MDYTLLRTELIEDIDFANNYITESFKDIEVLNSTNLIISKENISPTAIKMANIVTASVYKRQFGITLAIEDNDQNNKGFIDRIIDAIKRAINWIVDKIKQFWKWLTNSINNSNSEDIENRLKESPRIEFSVKNNKANIVSMKADTQEDINKFCLNAYHSYNVFHQSSLMKNKLLDMVEIEKKISNINESKTNEKQKADEIKQILIQNNLSNKYTDNVINDIEKDSKKTFNSDTVKILSVSSSIDKIEIDLSELKFTDNFLYATAIMNNSLSPDSKKFVFTGMSTGHSYGVINSSLNALLKISENLNKFIHNDLKVHVNNYTKSNFIDVVMNQIQEQLNNGKDEDELTSSALEDHFYDSYVLLKKLLKASDINSTFLRKPSENNTAYTKLNNFLDANYFSKNNRACDTVVIYTGVKQLFYIPDPNFDPNTTDIIENGYNGYVPMKFYKTIDYLRILFDNNTLNDETRESVLSSITFDYESLDTWTVSKSYQGYKQQKAHVNKVFIEKITKLSEDSLNYINILMKKHADSGIFDQNSMFIFKYHNTMMKIFPILVSYITVINTIAINISVLFNKDYEEYFSKITKKLLI